MPEYLPQVQCHALRVSDFKQYGFVQVVTLKGSSFKVYMEIVGRYLVLECPDYPFGGKLFTNIADLRSELASR